MIGYALPNPFGLSVVFSGVPIDTTMAGACYAGQPFTILATISESNMGPPSPIVGASLTFMVKDGGTTIAQGTATSDIGGEATWIWSSPILGNHILSVTWAGNADHPSGGSVGNIPLNVVAPSNPTQPVPFDYMLLLNWFTIIGAALTAFSWWKR